MDLLTVTHFLNGLIMILLPIGLAIYLTHRFRTGWRLVWIGAATFIIAQVGHIPFNYILTKLFENGNLPPPPVGYELIFSSVILGLSSGIWEESARYIAYRWPAKDARSWRKALLLGTGHGGIEALILGLLVLFTFIQLMAIRGRDLTELITPEQLGLVQQQVSAYWSLPWYETLLGAVERAFTLVFHLAASVIVLQCFIRQQIRWLFLAIALHAILNASAVYVAGTYGPYAAEAVIGFIALICLGIIFGLKTPEPEPETNILPELPPILHADDIKDLANLQESEEKIEETRYN